MPQRAKTHLGRPKSRRSRKVEEPEGPERLEEPEEVVPPEKPPEPEKPKVNNAAARLEFYARIAWLPEYSVIYAMEAELNGASVAVEQHASGYRRRQLKKSGNEDKRSASVMRISQDHERFLREANMHYVPFSQAIKSANYVVDQEARKSFDKERKDRRVAGRDFGTALLAAMVKPGIRPEPEEPRNPDVTHFVFDQTNVMAGGGTGHGSKKFGGIGRLDEDGKRVEVQRETYINSFDVYVSDSDCQLSDAARDTIARRGPYTQDFARVVPILAPERAETFMNELLHKASASVGKVARLDGTVDVQSVSRQILGRRHGTGGRRLRIEDLPPLMKTNTASLQDGVKIIAHYRCYKRKKEETVGVVNAATGDGQSVLLMSYLKRHWPEQYKSLLVLNGGFHSSGHFQIQGITILAWKAFYGRLAAHLELTPVKDERKGTIWENMKNLDKNAHWHTQQFAYTTVVATVVYIINYVKRPPPELFLQNPTLYLLMVENATGIVMLQALRNVGLPTVEWHQAAREVRGRAVDRLHGIAYHQFRATHKTNSQVISIIHLLSMYATHPELREWLWRTNSGMLINYAQ